MLLKFDLRYIGDIQKRSHVGSSDGVKLGGSRHPWEQDTPTGTVRHRSRPAPAGPAPDRVSHCTLAHARLAGIKGWAGSNNPPPICVFRSLETAAQSTSSQTARAAPSPHTAPALSSTTHAAALGPSNLQLVSQRPLANAAKSTDLRSF